MIDNSFKHFCFSCKEVLPENKQCANLDCPIHRSNQEHPELWVGDRVRIGVDSELSNFAEHTTNIVAIHGLTDLWYEVSNGICYRSDNLHIML